MQSCAMSTLPGVCIGPIPRRALHILAPHITKAGDPVVNVFIRLTRGSDESRSYRGPAGPKSLPAASRQQMAFLLVRMRRWSNGTDRDEHAITSIWEVVG